MKPTPGNIFTRFIPCALWDSKTICCAEGARYFYKRRDCPDGPQNKTYRCATHRLSPHDPDWEEISQEELIDAWEVNRIMIE